MSTTIYFERGSLLDAAIRTMAYAVVAPFAGVVWLLMSIAAQWRLFATVSGLVGAVVASVLFPVLPVGLAMVAAFAVLTYPQTAVR